MDEAPDEVPTCRCGSTREGANVVEEPRYSGVDYLWMLAGVSSRPVPYEVRCVMCNFVFEVTEPKRPW